MPEAKLAALLAETRPLLRTQMIYRRDRVLGAQGSPLVPPPRQRQAADRWEADRRRHVGDREIQIGLKGVLPKDYSARLLRCPALLPVIKAAQGAACEKRVREGGLRHGQDIDDAFSVVCMAGHRISVSKRR
jgi:hypothetical protein